MTVRIRKDGGIELRGDCPSEDAEALLRGLLASPQAVVDWRACDTLHAAVVQVLMASRATLAGSPRGAFLRQMLEPAIKAG